ncbi:23S rRNA (guanosine(2251)-2'-O)-methyltransferase RlmB [Treponema brennaborense]|uniref:RNA methyltransferase, TrmH family, group 3 n=1 Tax=Treponema brennaborense (strain DSM 12168 / CIP 105900 / DD5/3) TaxID=906968 RepID=F4LMT8_TREBD|nr:23S rRNA (guanosine(2251)-2'-O)-methyltransferase RlmB [Treponema brennaborense]AEE17828.1 RNA methyltransferase, TrmH family, group 3 [Treponema brennaborense DSM 12168]
MADKIVTGFHAVEEYVRRAAVQEKQPAALQLFYAAPGPRVKKILAAAEKAGIPCKKTESGELDKLTASLSVTAREHRGVVLRVSGAAEETLNRIDFDGYVASVSAPGAAERQTVVVLDSVTDPHNIGAILRSCDQLGVSLAVLPERRGVKNVDGSEVISRASAGASAWVPISIASNLVRAVGQLKAAGFWIYGADSGGTPVTDVDFPPRTVLIMGSEGSGISRLLAEQCDRIVSIPTCGKLDSLNVSVAAGILLYDIYRKSL